jgi:hypothetical protein
MQIIISWDLGEQLVEVVNGFKIQDWMAYVNCLLSIACCTKVYMCYCVLNLAFSVFL